MDVTPILDPLNSSQRDAVTAENTPALVIAGAGSGKTRVLVHRIAWLCEVQSVSPYSMLAVTFTNKAAAEMRTRVENLLNHEVGGLWIGTFHGISHRLLRTHWQAAGLKENFQVLDSGDQLRLLKRILQDLGMDDSKQSQRQIRGYINRKKDEGLRATDLQSHEDQTARQLKRIYTAYEQECERTATVDFAELLLRSLELLQKKNEILTQYREKFCHILVDEFQDTNVIQYKWLKMFAGKHNPIFAVGDDDQSIYGWRGARVENIQSFMRDYKNTQLFRLEQNYRSTNTILSVANSLIDNNQDRMGKKLWADSNTGEPVHLYAAFNEQDEARFVADRVQQWVESGMGRRDEIAILYRSNEQSRVFEEVFISQSIPYRVYGGSRFFERAEIRDALAYLRLANNADDDPSFERIVNTPPRGIGPRTMTQLRDFARNNQITLWDAAVKICRSDQLATRSANVLENFLKFIQTLGDGIRGLKLEEQIDHIIKATSLKAYYGREGDEKAISRIENLQELVIAARDFDFENELYTGMQPVDAFLSHASLEAGEGQGTQWEDCVQLMTLHMAKGLEFALVFIVGLEEGLFPLVRKPYSSPASVSWHVLLEEPGRLEEERRLCYVGITRARQQLVLTYAESRRRYGSKSYNSPSRFINEIPAELITEVRPRAMIAKPMHSATKAGTFAKDTGISIGCSVIHAKFGKGVVQDCEGAGSSARVQVNFEEEGCKWLVVSYANLDVLA
ncbi:MAG: DNA helicase II [Proteobacteria bacterium]|nr:DNA helicase II [Pseudomonadota bacterium]